MNNRKKALALLAAITVLFLMLSPAIPLRADHASDQAGTSLAGTEQGPNYFEAEGHPVSRAKKKSVLPIIGVAAAGAIAAVLVLVVFKTQYDIVGEWGFTFESTSPAKTWANKLFFSGGRKSGTFVTKYIDRAGTYKVDGKEVVIEHDQFDFIMTGLFDGKDRMTGTAILAGITIGGVTITNATWIATRLPASE